ncbi:MAG: hypothetical protein H7330_04020 [Hymenobacteraceae bacterium]|nr:hypothetical protein [Hymenobacteraceae bacterium]
MINPIPFFDSDFFDTRDVILRRLKKFSLAVILRLEQDNPASTFDALIASLKAFHDTLFGTMLAADKGIAQRRGYAPLMWGAIASLQDLLEADQDLIEYKGKKNPLIEAAFFPNGRNEYTKATLETADLLFSRAKDAATAHAATLGADFDKTKYLALYEQFKTARQQVGEGDEQAGAARAEGVSARDELTLRLTDAVKLVSVEFLRDAPRCEKFFPVHLLLPGEHDKEEVK